MNLIVSGITITGWKTIAQAYYIICLTFQPLFKYEKTATLRLNSWLKIDILLVLMIEWLRFLEGNNLLREDGPVSFIGYYHLFL